jgi:hydrogenase-4 membrane subunit HyfE
MEHRGLTNRATKKLRPLLLAAMIVLSIAVVGLHVVGGFALLKTGMSGLSLRDPLAYVMIGLFAVVAILKLTHIVGVMHRKEKREDAGEE